MARLAAPLLAAALLPLPAAALALAGDEEGGDDDFFMMKDFDVFAAGAQREHDFRKDEMMWNNGQNYKIYPNTPKTPYGREGKLRTEIEDTDHELCSPDDDTAMFVEVGTPSIMPFMMPKRQRTSNTTVLVLPGGGLKYLAWEKEGVRIAMWLNSLGLNAAVLKYRVPAERTFAIDVKRALAYLRWQIPNFGLDPDRIGVIGFGSGAKVAGALLEPDFEPQLGDEVDRLNYDPNFVISVYGTPQPRMSFEEALPLPPAFFVANNDDVCEDIKTVEEAFQAYRAKQKNAEFLKLKEAYHGYGDCSVYVPFGSKKGCSWTEFAKRWLRFQGFL